jgi:2-polyprenyl-3-methyl-5-hydroxy-6-metoxy-1,4-benzoquinol methylase
MNDYFEIDHVSLPEYRQTIEYLKNRLLDFIHKSSKILDAGCGSRNQLISRKTVELLIGCDIDECSIKENGDISVGIMSNTEEMGFRENTFDLIMSFDMIEHLKNPQAFIKNASKSLKQGGVIFLVTPNRNSIFGIAARVIPYKIKVHLTRSISESPTSNKVHWYRLNCPSSMVKALASNGFDNIRITLLNRLPSSPHMRKLLFPYYQICKTKFFSRYSTGLFCVARKSKQ